MPDLYAVLEIQPRASSMTGKYLELSPELSKSGFWYDHKLMWCNLSRPLSISTAHQMLQWEELPHLRGKRTSSFSLHYKILSLPLMAMTDLQRNWCRKAALTLVVAMSHTLPSSCTVERPLSSKNLLPSSLAGVWGAHRHWAIQRREACGPPVVQAKADNVKSSPPAEESINQAVTPKWKKTKPFDPQLSALGMFYCVDANLQAPWNFRGGTVFFPWWNYLSTGTYR